MFGKEEKFNHLIGSAEQIRINNSISGLGESISMGPNLPVAVATEPISQGPIKEPGNSYLTRNKCLNR